MVAGLGLLVGARRCSASLLPRGGFVAQTLGEALMRTQTMRTIYPSEIQKAKPR